MTTHLTPSPGTPTAAPNTHASDAAGLSAWKGIGLVARREILVAVRSRSFIASFLITLALVVGGIIASSVFSGGFGGPTTVAVTPSTAAPFENDAFESVESSSAAEALDAVRSGDADAAVVDASELQGAEVFGPDGRPLDLAGAEGPVVIGESSAEESVVEALTVTPAQAVLEPSPIPEGLAFILAIGFGAVFMMASIMYCTTIAQSVVEEKSTRIVEILLATVTPRVLMFGKVLGNAILALGQIAVIAGAAGIALAATGQGALLTLVGPAVVWFVVLFAVGFTLFASLYAGVAALVSRQEEVAGVTGPLVYILMIPYLAIVFARDNALVMTILSYVPFSAPAGMPVRVMLGQAMWWEPIVALVLLIATTAVVILIGARMYQRSILRTGSRVKLRDALGR